MNRIRKLGDLASDDAIKELIETLGDPNVVVRYLSGVELRRIGGTRVIDALGSDLKSIAGSAVRLDEVHKLLELLAETDADLSAQEKTSPLLKIIRGQKSSPDVEKG